MPGNDEHSTFFSQIRNNLITACATAIVSSIAGFGGIDLLTEDWRKPYWGRLNDKSIHLAGHPTQAAVDGFWIANDSLTTYPGQIHLYFSLYQDNDALILHVCPDENNPPPGDKNLILVQSIDHDSELELLDRDVPVTGWNDFRVVRDDFPPKAQLQAVLFWCKAPSHQTRNVWLEVDGIKCSSAAEYREEERGNLRYQKLLYAFLSLCSILLVTNLYMISLKWREHRTYKELVKAEKDVNNPPHVKRAN